MGCQAAEPTPEIASLRLIGNDLATNKTYDWSIYPRRANVSDHPQDVIDHAIDRAIDGDIKGDAHHHDLDQSTDAARIEAPGIVPDSGPTPPRKMINKLMIMGPSQADDAQSTVYRAQDDRAKSRDQGTHAKDWDGIRIDPIVAAAHDGKSGSARKTSAILVVAIVAGIAGALGTAMATAGVSYFASKPDPAIEVSKARALDESMTRIEQDLAALRSNVDRVAKASASQAGKTADRLDRIEKAQADPAAKLAKLNDTVEKLRVAAVTPPPPAPAAVPAPAAAPVASAPAKEITASITPKEAAAPSPSSAPKPEIARLPIVEGWVVLDAGNGGATIESRRGVYDVMAGDPVPGLGRVDAIRRQDGRWVVVTSKGLIVAR